MKLEDRGGREPPTRLQLGRIPVEQLDGERLTNIERRIVAAAGEMLATPVRTPQRFLAFAGAAMAVTTATAIGWKLRGEGAPAALPAKPQIVALSTEIRHSTLDLGDLKIASDPATGFDIARTDGRVLVGLAHGRIDLAVEHHQGRTVVVRAGDTEVEDVGTDFSVEFDGANSVRVRVTAGEVKITRHQHTELVAAGNEWTTAAGPVAIAEAGATPMPANPAPEQHGSDAAVVASVPAPAILHGRHAAVPDAPVAKRPGPGAGAPPHVADVDPRPRPIAQSADPYVELKLAIRKQPIAFDPGIDGRADATAEIAKLKKVAYSPTTMGGDASRALYAIAVLLHRPLAQDGEALRTLEVYRRRFSGGKEYTAALWLRVRLLCSRTLDDECRKAAYSYEHEMTSGDAADVALRITNSQ